MILYGRKSLNCIINVVYGIHEHMERNAKRIKTVVLALDFIL
jgi:hypothetical protein